MKSTITHISKNPDYASALALRNRLSESLAVTQEKVTATDAKLAEWRPPSGVDAVTTALGIIDGAKPTRAMDSLAIENADAKAKAEIIREAIAEQDQNIYALASRLSSEFSSGLRAKHVDVVRAIAKALTDLGAAMNAETALRESIEQAGYRCSLPSFQWYTVGVMSDLDSPLARHYRTTSAYADDFDDQASGALDKDARVHLLTDWLGAGKACEVVSLSGRLARHLVRLGKAEPTNEKPRRITEPTAQQVL